MYASQTWYTHAKKKKKKNATEVTVSDIHEWFDFKERSLHRAGATHVLTVVLAKGIISQVCRCFCKRNAFLRVGKAHDRFDSPFSSSPLRLRGFWLVRGQRQDKYRVWYSVKPLVVARVHVAERFPTDELLINRELRLQDHELANFVMWISRPRTGPVRKCQLGLS